jgi:hypothetical protein
VENLIYQKGRSIKMMSPIFYLLALATGLLFQTMLPGYIRMILIYPLSFILGLTTMLFTNYLALAFGIGMISSALLRGYWVCGVLEIILLVVGVFVSYLI